MQDHTITTYTGIPATTNIVEVKYNLMPAYGKVYHSEAEVVQAFDVDEIDFKVIGGPYCSIRNLSIGEAVRIWFGDNLDKTVIIELEETPVH